MSNRSNNEFFIGYLPHTPPGVRRWLMVAIAVMALLALTLGWVLGSHQRGESNAVFAFGEETVLEGDLLAAPVPLLAVPSGRAILLIGYGKHGAESTLQEAGALAGERLRIAGTLIHYNGKTLLEITRGAKAVERLGPAKRSGGPDAIMGAWELSGEVVDPKCYFGVMKPGEGKPHKACAIRCMEGGIPPVFAVHDSSGASQYFLLRGPSGEALNATIAPHVAVPLQLVGTVEQWADWLVLRTDQSAWRRIP